MGGSEGRVEHHVIAPRDSTLHMTLINRRPGAFKDLSKLRTEIVLNFDGPLEELWVIRDLGSVRRSVIWEDKIVNCKLLNEGNLLLST